MKRQWFSLVLLLVLLAGLALPAGPAPRALAAGPPWYVRGGFNGWGTDLMYDDGTHGDDVAGDGIYTRVITITTGGRYEFKVDDGNWTDPHPPSNAWVLTADANQPVKFTFDTNTYNDGWSPSTLIVNAQDGVTTWTAVGDWQGWNPSDPSTVMTPLGGGLYAYITTIPTAGTHYYKAVRSGTWDAIGPQGGEGGRSVNTDNLAFNTAFSGQQVRFLADVGRARIRVFVVAPVVINEFVAKGTEWIELYNTTAQAVDISGWTVRSDYGGTGGPLNYTVPAGTILPAGGYYSFNTGGDRLSNDGDVIHLIDPFGEVDAVGYGIRGGAPIPPTGYSCARTPNGQDTDDDARDWNLDNTSTRDAANDAAPVALGTSLILNEFDNYPPAGGHDKVEIYNPTDSQVDLNGWYLSDGDAVAVIVTHPIVPPGGWVVLEGTVDWTAAVDFASMDVGYLFLPDRTRVDQIGWYPEFEDNTFQRICDGAGPNDGYDWATSGGGTTWMDLPETLGRSNCSVDIAVEKFGPAMVNPYAVFTYTLSYEMLTLMAGHNIVITDTLPPGVTFVTFTSYLAVTLTQVTPTVVFDGGSLSGLMSNTIWLQVQVGDLPFGTVLTNTVEVTCTGDAVPGNNRDTLVSRVVGSEIGIAKTGTAFALPGEPISYTLTYEQVGEPAQNVVITDVLPVAVLYVSDTAPVTPTQISPNTLVWELGTVSATASFIVYGQVITDPMTWTVRNQVWVASTNDTEPGNNYAYWDTDLPMPIPEVQYPSVMSGTWPSRHVGEHVYVIGIVVADSQAYPSASGQPVRYVLGSLDAYGPWQGLFVYDPGRVVTESQVLVLGGTVNEYYGMTELGNIDYFRVLMDWWPPFPVLTTTAAITTGNPQQAEPLESVLVEVRCATVVNPDLGYGEWGIADESGVMARVDDLGQYTYVPQLGDVLYAVRGILFYTYDNFKLEPRYDADIVLAPTVRSVGPADGAVGVPISTLVTATFNIALNPSTVSTSTFFLEGPSGLIPGTVGYDPDTYTAIFTPSAALAYGTTYTAHLTTGIQSGEGAPMCAEYTWSFTTEEAPAPDLTPSTKEADRLYVHPGEVLTFTIRLINVGEIEAMATITDVLPAEVSVLTETLPPGMVYTDGLLLWSGVVLPLSQVPLPFQARVLDAPAGTVLTNLVWIDDGVHAPFTRTAFVEVLGVPDIEVSPLALSAVLNPGEMVTHTLTIRNVGEEVLEWSLTEVPTATWLAETPTGGVIQPAGQETVQVIFDATGLAEGTYTTTLDVASNDPDEPHVWVEVTLTVVVPVPDIEVSPLALSAVLNPGGTATRLLTIRNVGEEVLEWSLTEVPTATWLAETPTGGVVQPAGQETVQVTFDATGLVTGTYTTTLDVASNDPDEPHVWVEVTLVVTTACIPITGTDFTYTPPQPHPWQVITFTGSVAQGSEPITYTWDLGDGGTASGRVVTHTYTISSTYVVTLTAENACSQQQVRKTLRVAWPYAIYLPLTLKGYAFP